MGDDYSKEWKIFERAYKPKRFEKPPR